MVSSCMVEPSTVNQLVSSAKLLYSNSYTYTLGDTTLILDISD